MIMLAQDGYEGYGAGLVLMVLAWEGCDDGTCLQPPYVLVLKKMISTTPYHDSVY